MGENPPSDLFQIDQEMNHVPDYSNPPVVERILGVQFEPLPKFRNAHLGAFWKTLDARLWPILIDAPLLDPQFEVFSESAKWESGLRFRISKNISTRLQIKNESADRMIQIQNGRLHYNWLAGEHANPYPRYKLVRGAFEDLFHQTEKFLMQEEIGEMKPNQWEVTYVNHIPVGSVWSSPDDWSFFQLMGSTSFLEKEMPLENFSGEWHFVIPEKRGRLHVDWQHGSFDVEGENQVVRLTFTARGPVQNSNNNLESILAGLDLGHDTIVRSFERAMTDKANSFWGITHDLA